MLRWRMMHGGGSGSKRSRLSRRTVPSQSVEQRRLCFRRWLDLFTSRGVRDALVDLLDARQTIRIHRPLVPTNSLDARKAQREAAGVPRARLDLVGGDLQHDLRLNDEHAAPVLLARELHEDLGELLDLLVGHAAV